MKHKIKKAHKNTPRKLYPKRAAVFFGAGFLCFLYFLVVLLWGGAHTSIIWIWLAVAAVFSFAGVTVLFFGRLPTEKLLCVTAIILVISLFVSFAVFEVFVIKTALVTPPEGVECIIILGAAVKGTEPSKALYNRIMTALSYLERNPETVAVLSGGQGNGESISEAECMYRVLTEQGIDPSRLILEDKSRDTAENIKNSLELIDGKYNSIAAVTNNFHLYRAIRLAKARTDIPVYGIGAPFDSPLIVHFAVREYIGMCHDTLRGNV